MEFSENPIVTHIWNPETGKPITEFDSLANSTFNPDSTLLATWMYPKLELWATDSLVYGVKIPLVQFETPHIEFLAFNADGTRLFTTDSIRPDTRKVTVWGIE